MTNSSPPCGPSSIRALWQALERDDARTLPLTAWCQRFLPDHFPGEPAPFHAIIDGDVADLHTRRGARQALLGPRGSAKSSLITLGHVLREAIEGREPYVLLLSDAGGQAEKYLSDLRIEIEENKLLRTVYPSACHLGGEWRTSAMRLGNGTLIEALGRGARIRGRRNRQYRPSLIVLDDCQGNRDITSQAERGYAWEWFTREVIPTADDRTNILSVGTALHDETIAVRSGTLPGWSMRRFPAILQWPKQLDLWNEWERLATNLVDESRSETATAFYTANRTAMDEGAVTYWPSKWPILALMQRRAEVGSNAFDTEYQMITRAPEGAEWPPEYFHHDSFWFERWPNDIKLKTLFYDPAGGNESRPGDYHAVALLGITSSGDLWYEVHLWRATIEASVTRLLDITEAWKPEACGVEANFGGETLLPLLKMKAEASGRIAQIGLWKGIHNQMEKRRRIRRLGSYLERKQLHLKNSASGRMCLTQLEQHGLPGHDDGPDAMDGARQLAERILA